MHKIWFSLNVIYTKIQENIRTFRIRYEKSTHLSCSHCFRSDHIGAIEIAKKGFFRHFVDFYIAITDKLRNASLNNIMR